MSYSKKNKQKILEGKWEECQIRREKDSNIFKESMEEIVQLINQAVKVFIRRCHCNWVMTKSILDRINSLMISFYGQ